MTFKDGTFVNEQETTNDFHKIELPAFGNAKNLNNLTAQQETIQYNAGQTVFRVGDLAKGVYELKSGAIKLLINRELQRGRSSSPEFITKIVGPGELFGFQAVLQIQPQTHIAKVIKPSTVVLHRAQAQLNKPLEQVIDVQLQKKINHQLLKDLSQSEKISQLHYLASVEERIAYQLLLLGEKFGEPVNGGTLIALKLTRNELAQLAGTINESLSRHLGEFRNSGLIELRGKEIIIKNREELMLRSGNFKS